MTSFVSNEKNKHISSNVLHQIEWIRRMVPRHDIKTQPKSNPFSELSGYHADTPITIKAEAIRKADSHSN